MQSNINSENKNSETFKLIELFIQQNENVCIPAIIFEYCSNNSISFDKLDLYDFFEKFGEIEEFILNKKITIVLFRSFFSANTCREFMKNEHNFKDNENKKIKVKWFNMKDDNNKLPDFLKEKFYNIFMNNSLNLKTNIFNYKINVNNNNNNNNLNQNFLPIQNDFNYLNNFYNINDRSQYFFQQQFFNNNAMSFHNIRNYYMN